MIRAGSKLLTTISSISSLTRIDQHCQSRSERRSAVMGEASHFICCGLSSGRFGCAEGVLFLQPNETFFVLIVALSRHWLANAELGSPSILTRGSNLVAARLRKSNES